MGHLRLCLPVAWKQVTRVRTPAACPSTRRHPSAQLRAPAAARPEHRHREDLLRLLSTEVLAGAKADTRGLGGDEAVALTRHRLGRAGAAGLLDGRPGCAVPWSSEGQPDEGGRAACPGATGLLPGPGRSGDACEGPSEVIKNLRFTFQCFRHETTK